MAGGQLLVPRRVRQWWHPDDVPVELQPMARQLQLELERVTAYSRQLYWLRALSWATVGLGLGSSVLALVSTLSR